MRILIAGANGQLGREVVRQLPDTIAVFPLLRQELDVTARSSVLKTVLNIQPDVIINAAAYTSVDAAETDKENAYRVNALGAKNLAEAAEQCHAKLCHISTDYVFDGRIRRPYRCTDATSPQTVYGRSKLLGEQYVNRFCTRTFIVRTSWLYGAHGRNFVQTMLALATEPSVSSVKVVRDATGSPTWTHDLAIRLIELIDSNRYGTYHIANTGNTTWYNFAQEIFRLARIKKPVIPICASEFPRPAQRPVYSVLSSQELIKQGFQPLRHWRTALRAYFESMREGVEDESS